MIFCIYSARKQCGLVTGFDPFADLFTSLNAIGGG
jgi:hypothetical protein